MDRPIAAALAYTSGDTAPRITAKGHGRDAERILELAREAGVDIVEDASLARLLEDVDIGTYVPLICWEAVARILAFVQQEELT
ncbi:EscU/YscU/HrcU family type III secretion system export apparatus switch protein [Treponema sp.]